MNDKEKEECKGAIQRHLEYLNSKNFSTLLIERYLRDQIGHSTFYEMTCATNFLLEMDDEAFKGFIKEIVAKRKISKLRAESIGEYRARQDKSRNKRANATKKRKPR